MIGSVTKNGGRREMETYDRICDQKRRRREMETYDRICDQKRREKRNGKAEERWKLMIGSVTKNGGRREMETYDRICDQKRREKRNGNL